MPVCPPLAGKDRQCLRSGHAADLFLYAKNFSSHPQVLKTFKKYCYIFLFPVFPWKPMPSYVMIPYI